MFIKRIIDKKNIFYGWFVVLAAFIIMATGMGIVFNCSSLFIKPISEELGFTRQQAGAIITIRNACTMIIALYFGKIVNKFDIRKIMKISIIVLAISYFSYSFVNSLISLYIITLIVSISFSLIGVLPLSIIINNWFHENCGTAIGLAFMGSGVGGMIFNSLTGQFILSYGWRTTHQILAVIMFVTIVPTIFFLLRVHPREKNTVAYGDSKDLIEIDDEEKEGLTIEQAKKEPRFWLICIATMFHCMSITTIMFNIAPHLSDVGYSVSYSANIAALSMGSLAICKIIMGKLYDKIGIKISTTIASVATSIGLIGMIYARSFIGIIIIIICAGIAGAFGSIAIPIIAREVFGQKDYPTIYGILSATNNLGGVLTPLLSGYVFDVSGSYVPFFKIAVVISFIIIIAYQFIFVNDFKGKSAMIAYK